MISNYYQLLRIKDIISYSAIMSSDTFLCLCSMIKLIRQDMSYDESEPMRDKLAEMIGCNQHKKETYPAKTISIDEMFDELTTLGILTKEGNNSFAGNLYEIDFLNNLLWQIPYIYWGELYEWVQESHKPLSVMVKGMSLENILKYIKEDYDRIKRI